MFTTQAILRAPTRRIATAVLATLLAFGCSGDADTSMCNEDCDTQATLDLDTERDLDTDSDGTACEPDCDGLTCGPDGCGDTCGYCDAGVSCIEGTCDTAVTHTPPTIVSLGTNVSRLTENEDVTINVIVTDPNGIDDVIGGELTDPTNGATYGTFATAAAEGAYSMTISWADIHRVRPIDFTNEVERTFQVGFFDQEGAFTTEDLTLTLHCDGWGACEGMCTDLTSTDDCGTCDNTCGPDDLCDGEMCTCPGVEEDCGGRCFDLQVDSQHCGACGQSCRSDQTCGNGSCVCPGDGFECGGVCTTNDENNCGTCGNTCIPTKECNGVECACPAQLLTYTPERTEDVDLSIESLLIDEAETNRTGWYGEFDNRNDRQWRRYWRVNTTPGSTIQLGVTGARAGNTLDVMTVTLTDAYCNPIATLSTGNTAWSTTTIDIDDSGPYFVMAEIDERQGDNHEYNIMVEQLPVEKSDDYDFCDDNRDNDADGLVDCDDPDCECPCFPNSVLLTDTHMGRLENGDPTDGPAVGRYYDVYTINLPGNRTYRLQVGGEFFSELLLFDPNTCQQVEPENTLGEFVYLEETPFFGRSYYVMVTSRGFIGFGDYTIILEQF